MEKIETLIKKYEEIIDNFIDRLEDFIDKVVNLHIKLIATIVAFLSFIIKRYGELANDVYSFFRWTTIPFNYIIIRTWLWHILRMTEYEPLDETGVHFIRAKPGGGKSLLAYQKANEILDRTGYAAYFTDPVEKPKLTEDGKFWYVDHKLINLKSYYQSGKAVKRFNTKKWKSLWVDEFQILNNPRLNKKTEYNDFFIPFLNDLLTIRHDGFDNNIYLLSQIPNNDIQLMSMITKYHDIEIRKGINYLRWLRTGKFEILPIKWKISTYNIHIGDGGLVKKVLYRKWTKRVDIDSLDYFDTHARRGMKDHLKLDYN